MQDCIPAFTPEEDGLHLTALPSTSLSFSKADTKFLEQIASRLQYGSVIGSLSWAAISTRPDISHAVGVLSRFLTDPKPHHWIAAQRVLRYLKGTAHLGLTYRGNPESSNSLVLGPIYTDSDWAGDKTDCKSTGGMVTKMNGCAISWKSKKQSIVAQSSAEAEYIASAEGVREALWLRQLLTELSFAPSSGTLMFGDNKTAISMAENMVTQVRSKHIDIKHHFLRDHVQKGDIDLQWISTEEQEADIFTKALGKNLFCKFRNRIMGAQ
jgi:hypothetical protein